MRTVWVSDTFEQLNGVATYLKSTLPLLKKKIDVELYTGRVKKNYDFPIRSIPNFPVPLQADYDFIIPNFRRINADVLHVHTAYSLGLYSSMLPTKKVVTTHLHPYHLLEGTFGCNQPRIFQSMAWKFVVSFFNRFDVVVCQTNATKDMYQEKGLRARAEVIPNGMDTTKNIDSYVPKVKFAEKYGIKGDFAFYLGRIDASKGIDWVIEATEKMPQRQFVIVGKGTLESKIPKRDNIHYFKYLDHDDKDAAFAECAMTLMPSCVETEGIVAQEAMLYKKPVLVSNNPVLKEVVGRGGIACGSVEELIEKTEYLFGDPSARAEIGEKALEDVKKRDINRSVEKLVKVYESLV
jgi:glycosyltransferase involved in cell wall biosynthesis